MSQEKVDDYEKVKTDQRKAAKAAELMRQIHEAELQEVCVEFPSLYTCVLLVP